jgi:hypothetical protein
MVVLNTEVLEQAPDEIGQRDRPWPAKKIGKKSGRAVSFDLLAPYEPPRRTAPMVIVARLFHPGRWVLAAEPGA